ncbi:replication factor C large subunit [Pancytospora epiphaga]|nr:replication factor C large subunit [Pancytospora epiphaga]
MSQPWFIKYRPSRFTELCFDGDPHIRALQWLKDRKEGVLHIKGPHGCGKTVLVHALAKSLKYNVIEVTNESLENIKTGILQCRRALNNLPSLLLVDEDFFTSQSYSGVVRLITIFSKRLPVILTSADVRYKDGECIKIGRPGMESIQRMMEAVCKKACKEWGVRLGVVAKIAERCNFDMRAVLNYYQVYGGGRQSPISFQGAEHITTIFSTCDKIFRRRIGIEELESSYDGRLLNICLNSLFKNSQDVDFMVRCLDKASVVRSLSPAYHFLELEHINRHRGEFTYMKDGYLQRDAELWEGNGGHSSERDIKQFISCITRRRGNHRSFQHLQKILSSMKPEELSSKDLEVLRTTDIEVTASIKFRYKYSSRASSAVRRDVSLAEIIE